MAGPMTAKPNLAGPITAKELKTRIGKESLVEVSGFSFRIRKVPLLLLSEDANTLWDQARLGHDQLADIVKSLISHPTLPMLKRILFAGVVEPKFSDIDSEESVSIELVLAKHELSVGLFIEIVNLSLEV